MIPDAALADRLADREAQRQSYQRVDAFARKWGSHPLHPLMTQLEREVSGLKPRTAAALLAARRPKRPPQRQASRSAAAAATLHQLFGGALRNVL